MKRLFFALVAVLALGAIVYHLKTRSAPAIAIALQDETGGGANYLPAVEGFIGGGILGGNHDQVTCSYKVATSSPGHLFILAHYAIERDGISSQIDEALPVQEKRPDPAVWSKLDNHFHASAYLVSGSTINY